MKKSCKYFFLIFHFQIRQMTRIFLILTFLSSVIHAQPTFDLQGHRGARGLAPENSFPSMVEALKYGVTTLELDVVISKDGQVIVSHEPWMNPLICLDEAGKTLKKTAPLRHNIKRMTVEEIKKYDCGSKVHPKFPHQQLQKVHKPTLKELVKETEAYIHENSLPTIQYNIEIKCYKMGTGLMHPRPKKFIQLVMLAIHELGIEQQVTIQSFSYKPLRYLHKHHPQIPLSLLVDDDKSMDTHIQKLGFIPHTYSPRHTLVNKKLVENCHQKSIKIIPWTVNHKKDIEKMISLGVDGLITDYPNIAREVLNP